MSQGWVSRRPGFGGFFSLVVGENCSVDAVAGFVLVGWDIARGSGAGGGVEPRDDRDDRQFELAAVRQTRSRMSSVLKVSTKLSARALS